MKRLLVFVFAVVLFGSCSKQKTVKFVVELTSDITSFESPDCYSNSNNAYNGWTELDLDYFYISSDGVSQSEGNILLKVYTPNYPNSNATYYETIKESSPITMLKGDNVQISYRVINQCVEGQLFTVKAIVNDNKEHIITENDGGDPVSMNGVFTSTYPPRVINWIVP